MSCKCRGNVSILQAYDHGDADSESENTDWTKTVVTVEPLRQDHDSTSQPLSWSSFLGQVVLPIKAHTEQRKAAGYPV
ncbi:hypothetical protein OPT61_g5961 [Boeremia exigua]|uniref:Uncharacterized protein n=1 Tax=Boeremia exigua TaxID=749465 RepID=A0ACC2I8E4_9PLEO|nr:hypothetical protein OPT61_g5961 [Boeremia exigua]